jgi:hypothetical protein
MRQARVSSVKIRAQTAREGPLRDDVERKDSVEAIVTHLQSREERIEN